MTALRTCSLAVLAVVAACTPPVAPPVNHPPSIGTVAPQTGTEDTAGSVVVSGIDAGDAGQTVTLSVASDKPMFSSLTITGVSAGNATILYTPAHDLNGTARITITADDGQGENHRVQASFDLTLTPVNDPPLFTPPAQASVFCEGWFAISGIAAGGGPDEDTQPVVITATDMSNPHVLENITVSSVDQGVAIVRYRRSSGATGPTVLLLSATDSDTGNVETTHQVAVELAAMRVTGANALWAPAEVGAAVQLSGEGFDSGTKIHLDSATLPTSVSADGTLLTFTAPASTRQEVTSFTIENSCAQTVSQPFAYVLKRDPGVVSVDGTNTIAPDAEWPALYRLGSEPDATTTAGSELHELHAAYDDESVYLAISGTLSGGNGLLVYVDRDFKTANGVSDFKTFADQTGALDAMFTAKTSTGTSTLTNQNGLFAPEFGIGTTDLGVDGDGNPLGMASIGLGDPTNDLVGGRAFFPLTAFTPLALAGDSVVQVRANATDGFTEIELPWEALGGKPAAGTLGFAVRISTPDGAGHTNQTLPNQTSPSNVIASDGVATLEIR